MRTLWQGFWSGVFAFITLLALALSILLVAYASMARDLPAPEELSQRADTFRSTRIYDREGNLLTETFDPNAGRRTVVALDRMTPAIIQATIATEDANFYYHRGIDPVALLRALYYAVRERDIVSGASTIPQQLVKRIFLTPERTLTRKLKEAILAAEITRRFSKDAILEIYLNELYYGNFAYGVDTAAQTYFGKDVAELTLAEASLLAGLPQAPAYYDPYSFPDRAKNRQSVVLGLMVENEMITQAEADAAWLQALAYIPVSFDLKSPHYTLFVRQQLESLLGPDTLYSAGLQVTTALDPQMQAAAERIVAEQIQSLGDRNVSNGALVAIDPQTGEVLALVGSADFENVEIDGQVNMALSPRQPGSSIKPLVYLSAFEQSADEGDQAWTPGTLLADIESEFPDAQGPYVPKNYDEKEHGLVTVRSALANSFNIPAVRALQKVDIPAFLDLAQRVGITTMTRPDYGLSLGLGAGETTLLELTGAFGVLAANGVRHPPITILQIADSNDTVLCQFDSPTPCRFGAESGGSQQVVSPVDAFLITDILQDNEARSPMFGRNSVLNIGRPAAVKTGTTNDFRDNLTVGYTPQLVVGVWVGNSNNSPMRNVSGVTGAGPIWAQFMQDSLADQPIIGFTPPPGVVQMEVCAETGTRPSQACPARAQWWFAQDRPPLPAERDLYQTVRLDRTTGKLATEFTPAEAIDEQVFKVYPAEYREWAAAHGIPQPPAESSDLFTFAPDVDISAPAEGVILSGRVEIRGSANIPGLVAYELRYGISHNPGAFSLPFHTATAPVTDGVLGYWDTSGLDEGPHTLQLIVRDQAGAQYEKRVRLFVAPAFQTETPTATVEAPTPTWTPTWTPPPPQGSSEATPVPSVETVPPPPATESPTPEAVEATATPVPSSE